MLKQESNRRAALMLAALLVLGGCGGGAGSGVAEALPADSRGASSEPSDDHYLGKPRKDVERYIGLYGEPGRGQFFVTEAKRPKYAEQAPEIPAGYLAIGAMWADVAPMHMKSLSETKFKHVDRSDFAPPETNVAEFEFGPDGKAVALTFTSGGLGEFGRRVRVGDLPKELR